MSDMDAFSQSLTTATVGEVEPTCSAPLTVGAGQEYSGFIQMYFTPEDFYDKFFIRALLVYPILVQT